MRSQSDCCSYYPLQRLKLRKLGETAGGKNEKIREEKEASARCHTQDSRYPGVNFFNFQPARLGSLRSNFFHSLFLMSVVTVGPVWLTWPYWCRMLSRVWETTKDTTGQRFTAHEYQGTVTLGVRHEKAKTISVIFVTYLSLTGQCSSWSRLWKTLEDWGCPVFLLQQKPYLGSIKICKMRFACMVKNSLKVYFFDQFTLHGMSFPLLMF